MKLGEAIEEVIKAKGMKWATVDAPHRTCACAAIMYDLSSGFVNTGSVPIRDGEVLLGQFQKLGLSSHSKIVHQLDYPSKKNEPLDYIVLDIKLNPVTGSDCISSLSYEGSSIESTIAKMRADGYYGRLRIDWRIVPDVD